MPPSRPEPRPPIGHGAPGVPRRRGPCPTRAVVSTKQPGRRAIVANRASVSPWRGSSADACAKGRSSRGAPPKRLYPGGGPRRHRDPARACRLASAGDPVKPRGGQVINLRQQPSSDRLGASWLPQLSWKAAVCLRPAGSARLAAKAVFDVRRAPALSGATGPLPYDQLRRGNQGPVLFPAAIRSRRERLRHERDGCRFPLPVRRRAGTGVDGSDQLPRQHGGRPLGNCQRKPRVPPAPWRRRSRRRPTASVPPWSQARNSEAALTGNIRTPELR